jgi:hypothetical protein
MMVVGKFLLFELFGFKEMVVLELIGFDFVCELESLCVEETLKLGDFIVFEEVLVVAEVFECLKVSLEFLDKRIILLGEFLQLGLGLVFECQSLIFELFVE